MPDRESFVKISLVNGASKMSAPITMMALLNSATRINMDGGDIGARMRSVIYAANEGWTYWRDAWRQYVKQVIHPQLPHTRKSLTAAYNDKRWLVVSLPI